MPADARYAYVASLGDDALVLGQRLGEWCGHAPTLELDLSLANLGLDLIGQADHLLGYAAELEGAGRSADDLAFRRDVLAFRNCLLVEQPNGDFARTLARPTRRPRSCGACAKASLSRLPVTSPTKTMFRCGSRRCRRSWPRPRR